MFAKRFRGMCHGCSTGRLVLILSLTAGLWCGRAQVYYATLVGTVRDVSGAIVPDAQVTAVETSTRIEYRSSANATGDYRIDNLRPGQYSISVTKPGFKTKVASDLTLYVSQTSRVDVELEIGTASQTVTITTNAPLVQTETADRGSILAATEIETMPLNTRNIMELTYLTPGAQANSTYFNEPMVSVNGRGVYDNQFNIDGGSITSAYMNLPVERPSIDSIQEFKIETSNMSAEYGLHAGGIVTIATKHGTNEFHGTLFEFFRNDQLNARNFFDVDRPPLRYNQFGGNIGGPVVKDKLFFFFSYEGARERRSQPFLSTVPTMAERQGSFQLGTGAKDAPIFNPYDVPATGLRMPFSNNQIPASMLDKVAVNYLSIFPLPNREGFPNYYFSSSGINDFNRYSARVDWNLTSKDTLIGRFGHQGNPVFTPGPLPGADMGTKGNLLDGADVQITWNHLIGSSSLNQFRFSFANLEQTQVPSDFYGKQINTTLGFDVPNNLDPFVTGCPWVSFSGVSTTGVCQNAIWTFPNKTIYLSDDYSFRHGTHTVKLGVLHMRYLMDTKWALDGGLLNSFSGLYTAQIGDYSGGQPFADFLLGAEQGITVNSNVQLSPDRRNSWQMYFQDDWKLHPRVTLQLGLRYDVNLPSTIANGRAGAWLEGLGHRTGQLIIWPKNAKGPLQQVLGGNPLGFPDRFSDNNWLYKPNWKNLGPRVGIAYRPFNDNRTVIRGGYGIYYDFLVGTMTNNRNFGRPFFTFGSTPPRPVDFEPPPYLLGQFPAVPNYFKPGEPFRSGYVFSPEWPDARVQQWNLTVQRDLGHRFVLEVGYVGNRASQEVLGLRINQSFPLGYTFRYDDGSSFTIQDSTPLLQRKKYPELRAGTAVVPWGHGTYNAAQMVLTKQMSAGLEFRVGYTRSRTYGNVSIDQQPTIQDEWSLNSLNFYETHDLPNIFFGTFVWELPGKTLKGPLAALVGGWRAGGIIHVQSGPRVDVLENSPQFEGAGGSVKPIMVCDPNLPASRRSLDRWFNTSCFQQPGPDQLGSNSAYYSVRSAPLRAVDFSLSKSFKLTELKRLSFRAEAFNLFNHPTFGAPDTNRGDATFGQVTSAGRARELQLALKLQF